MDQGTHTLEKTAAVANPADRREWLRIDEHLLLEYRLADEPPGSLPPEVAPATKELIKVLVNKPTHDLISRAEESLTGSPLLPWFTKVDYLLETILTSLATIHPGSVAIPRPTEVNISAGGLSFPCDRAYDADSVLALRFFIPPFTPIQTQARVVRSIPDGKTPGRYRVAVEFTTMSEDDREIVIRHILRTQADQLRARKQAAASHYR